MMEVQLLLKAYKNDGNGNDAGHVRIYENSGGLWSQIGQDIDGENVDDFNDISKFKILSEISPLVHMVTIIMAVLRLCSYYWCSNYNMPTTFRHHNS